MTLYVMRPCILCMTQTEVMWLKTIDGGKTWSIANFDQVILQAGSILYIFLMPIMALAWAILVPLDHDLEFIRHQMPAVHGRGNLPLIFLLPSLVKQRSTNDSAAIGDTIWFGTTMGMYKSC